MKVTREVAFEDAIVDWLVVHAGYTRGIPTNYDPAVALDTGELFTFIGATQAEAWEDLVQRNGATLTSPSDGSSNGWPHRSTSGARSTSSATGSRTSVSRSVWRTSGRPQG